MNPPALRNRLQAAVALLSLVAIATVIVVTLWRNPGWLLLAVAGWGLLGWGGWWVVTERMPRRAIGAAAMAVGMAAVVASLAGVLVGAERLPWAVLAVLAVLTLTATAATAARLALVQELHRRDETAAPPPTRPVLIANRKSGGGKVDRYGLLELAESLGIETVVLDPGDDLEQLARDAVARGADCLGMAGGDGSQALVASVAVEHGIPFVCVSAGTRNHFAMDLGLDREEPAEGVHAFRDGVERRVDYATVGDRLFVNNVSLGVYGEIVQSDEYRDAKLDTSLELLPDLLGSPGGRIDLRFRTPDGTEIDDAYMILVSNNPYLLRSGLRAGQRPSLTTGKLGVLAINAETGAQAASVVVRSALGVGGTDPSIHQFTTDEFVVEAASGRAAAGVDGEAVDLASPLRFRSHPRGMLVRVPAAGAGRLTRRRARNISATDLVRVAMGKPVR